MAITPPAGMTVEVPGMVMFGLFPLTVFAGWAGPALAPYDDRDQFCPLSRLNGVLIFGSDGHWYVLTTETPIGRHVWSLNEVAVTRPVCCQET
jgi:hypothetical protein